MPRRFEGGQLEELEVHQDNPELEGTDWGPASQEITNVNTVEGTAEIKG